MSLDTRSPRSPLVVRGRRAQYGGTGPEGRVLRAAAGGGGAGLCPARAAAGEESA
jgi:hypothetical protein